MMEDHSTKSLSDMMFLTVLLNLENPFGEKVKVKSPNLKIDIWNLTYHSSNTVSANAIGPTESPVSTGGSLVQLYPQECIAQ